MRLERHVVMWNCCLPWGGIFSTKKRHYLYWAGKDEEMVRFCVPHLVNADEYDVDFLSEAMNETNRSVKFIKVVKLDCGSVSLNYDHKAVSDDETAETIVPHIINALDFASTYLLDKLKRKEYRRLIIAPLHPRQ